MLRIIHERSLMAPSKCFYKNPLLHSQKSIKNKLKKKKPTMKNIPSNFKFID